MNEPIDRLRNRALNNDQKRIAEAKEGRVSLSKWKKFKAEYPQATMEDYKRVERENRRIAAQNKRKFCGARNPNINGKEAKTSVEKATPPPQAKDVFGATPNQQDDLICANQMSFTGEKTQGKA